MRRIKVIVLDAKTRKHIKTFKCRFRFNIGDVIAIDSVVYEVKACSFLEIELDKLCIYVKKRKEL